MRPVVVESTALRPKPLLVRHFHPLITPPCYIIGKYPHQPSRPVSTLWNCRFDTGIVTLAVQQLSPGLPWATHLRSSVALGAGQLGLVLAESAGKSSRVHRLRGCKRK